MNKHPCSEGQRRCIRKVPRKPTFGVWRRKGASARELFQRLKSLSMEDTRKLSSQHIHDKEVKVLRDPGLILGRWPWFSFVLLDAKFDKFRLDIMKGLPQWFVTHALGANRPKAR